MSGYSRIREKKYIAHITIMEAILTKSYPPGFVRYPYCKVISGGMVAMTLKGSGSNPKWGEKLSFEVEDRASVQLVVCDEHPQFGEIEIGECRVNLHKTLPEIEIKNCIPLRNVKGDQTGSIIFVVCKSEAFGHNISTAANRTMTLDNNSHLFPSQLSHQVSQQMLVPHLGRIEKSYDFGNGIEPSFYLEDERTQLQIIQQELHEQGLSFKQQEEKIRKSMEQINHSKTVIKKQRIDLKQTQDSLGKLQYKLNTERMQISRERQEIEQEKSQLLQLKQGIMEEGLRIYSERKKFKLTKSSITRLQDHIVVEERKNNDRKAELAEYELLIMKKRAALALKEKALKEPLKKPFGKMTSMKPNKHPYEEDKVEPDMNQTYSSKNKKSDNEELINASGVTANFPNSSSNSKDEPLVRASNFRKEQDLEDKLKGIEEEKAKLTEDRKNTEAQKKEIQKTKAHLTKELEGNRQFSFVRKVEPEPETANLENQPEIQDVEVVIHESKSETPLPEEESMEFKPDPNFLEQINKNIERNNENSPEKVLDVEEDKHIVMESLGEFDQSPIIEPEEEDVKDKSEYNQMSVDRDDSSDESSIYKDNELFDQPKKGKYGIKPVIKS